MNTLKSQPILKYLLLIFLSVALVKTSAQPDTIHVVFKTHLDIGFTDFPGKVVDLYFKDYIPKAINTGRALQKSGNDRFIWTAGSWIISQYLDKATPEKKKELEEAIRDGIITWNAYPYTFDSELTDASLFEYALSIAAKLDQQFGKKTIAAKITDVPGETIGSIGLLNKAGIRMLHIGVNGASTRPDTPPVFLWKDARGGELVVLYHNLYGGTFSSPGMKHILHFAFTGDNLGPQTPGQVHNIFNELRQKYPGSVVIASTMDAFAHQIWKVKDELPVITGEIGNTWIHSAGTDPKKYTAFRALMRLRTEWLTKKLVNPDDQSFRQFSDFLLLAVEHTGGLDEKMNLDFDHYSPSEMVQVLDQPNYRRMIQSWNDAREYLTKAVNALGNSPLADQAHKELALLEPQKPFLNGYKEVSLLKPLSSKYFDVIFDENTGAIVSLKLKTEKTEMADPLNPIGLFWHESFSDNDYKRFFQQYITPGKEWALKDFGKPNISEHGAVNEKRLPKVIQAYVKQNNDGISMLMHLSLAELPPTDYGLPSETWLQIDFPFNKKEINYTVQWFGKKPCRLPESYWFSFGFNRLSPDDWAIEKINSMVSPLDVIQKGGRSLHGFNRGVFYNDGNRKIEIESTDTPIIAPGVPSLLDFNDELPDLSKGWHFNLFNNKWGTNFPTWYSDDAKFRFNLRF